MFLQRQEMSRKIRTENWQLDIVRWGVTGGLVSRAVSGKMAKAQLQGVKGKTEGAEWVTRAETTVLSFALWLVSRLVGIKPISTSQKWARN